jgi:twitching motility protein PilI
MATNRHPIRVLYDIEQQCISVARGLPQQQEVEEIWTGIGFRIADFTFVAPLAQVSEILHYPKLTSVPGTRSWIKGIANIRGTLLPVMDLSAYLGKKHIGVNNQSRILVARHEEMAFGMLVDEVLGLKHYRDEDKTSSVSRFDESLQQYVQGAFRHGEEESLVFNLHELAVHPDFYKVAV